MKISPPRNFIYFNLLFLGLIIPSFNPALSEIIISNNSLSNNLKKSFFEGKLKFNNYSQNKVSGDTPHLVLNEILDQSRNII